MPFDPLAFGWIGQAMSLHATGAHFLARLLVYNHQALL